MADQTRAFEWDYAPAADRHDLETEAVVLESRPHQTAVPTLDLNPPSSAANLPAQNHFVETHDMNAPDEAAAPLADVVIFEAATVQKAVNVAV